MTHCFRNMKDFCRKNERLGYKCNKPKRQEIFAANIAFFDCSKSKTYYAIFGKVRHCCRKKK